ncbi:transcription repressor OFP12-like [Prosopis cineraria]|uniref:transcription repressor OFP12-like n=1 Tax=Prosopis cineraria TaxID=364024 RepID=UPI0024108677|nr:transcription repressor OFP12-like [Prosopis cineraria]XP_054790164.1 transcription repressor OFP12-like [Prosopis cineraria]
MLDTIGRNLNQCFSKLMRPLISPEASSSSSGSTHQDDPAVSPATTSSPVFVKNFNSLYDSASDFSNAGNEPDLATAFASRRFFFSSPGRSNSIVESSAAAGQNRKVFNNSVAVPTFSPDPYVDFRRSMQEMVEARPELMDVNSNWEILHELLLCYLALNPKHTHKYIVGAFADLLVNLMPSPPPDSTDGIITDVVGAT